MNGREEIDVVLDDQVVVGTVYREPLGNWWWKCNGCFLQCGSYIKQGNAVRVLSKHAAECEG